MDHPTELVALLRQLAVRVAALEDHVRFLELWCEEQQDALDILAGPWPWSGDDHPPVALRLVDRRAGDAGGPDVAAPPAPPQGADARAGIRQRPRAGRSST